MAVHTRYSTAMFPPARIALRIPADYVPSPSCKSKRRQTLADRDLDHQLVQSEALRPWPQSRPNQGSGWPILSGIDSSSDLTFLAPCFTIIKGSRGCQYLSFVGSNAGVILVIWVQILGPLPKIANAEDTSQSRFPQNAHTYPSGFRAT